MHNQLRKRTTPSTGNKLWLVLYSMDADGTCCMFVGDIRREHDELVRPCIVKLKLQRWNKRWVDLIYALFMPLGMF